MDINIGQQRKTRAKQQINLKRGIEGKFMHTIDHYQDKERDTRSNQAGALPRSGND